MTNEPVLYTHPFSRGRNARWMLEETGQPYRTELLEYDASMKDPAYLAINPLGKVPALRHGQAVITETAAICAYLADAFPEAGLAPPAGDPRRGEYYRWLFFCAGPLEAAIIDRQFGLTLNPEQQRVAGYGKLEVMLDVIEQAMGKDLHMVGGKFSAADLIMCAVLSYALLMARVAGPRPVFQSFLDLHGQRPAAIRARAADDALLAAKKA